MYIWKVRYYEVGGGEKGEGYYVTNMRDLGKLEKLLEEDMKIGCEYVEIEILSAEFLGECVVLKG